MRTALALHQLLVRRPVAGPGLLEAPLALEECSLVKPGGVLLELDALDDAGAPEGRLRDRIGDGDVGAHALLGLHGLRDGGVPLGHPALLQFGEGGAGDTALDRDEGVHQPEPLEGVAGVTDLALVDLVEVLFDVGTGQGRPAEDHRVVGRQLALVQLLQVLLHDHGGLHQEARHADDIGAVLLGGVQDRGDGLLDAQVDHVEAVVGQDDVDEVLADVVDVAADRGQHDGALALGVGLLHVRFEVRHRGLHDLGGLEHEGKLHLAGAEQFAHDLHAGQQRVVDDLQRGCGQQRLVEVRLQPVLLAVDDAALEPLVQRQGEELLGLALLHRLHVDALEELHEPLEGVVALLPAVVDEVEGDLDLLLLQPGDREDLGGVDDGGVQAGLHALVEEDGVQDDAGGGVQAEGDVGQAQRGLDVGAAPLQLADGADGGDPVLAGLLLTGTDGEGQAVDEDVRLADAPVGGEVLDEPLGDGDLVLDGAGLALLVDGQRDERGAVLGGEPGDLREAGLGTVAVLVVDGVQYGASAQLLQACAQDGDLGGVEDDRQGRGGGETAGQFLHVGDAVAPHVVDAEVEHVGAFADLVPGHLHAVVPAGVEHGLAELLGSVGVRTFADREVRGVLPERDGLVERRGTRLGAGVARRQRGAADPLDEPAQVFRRRTAAAAHEGEAVLLDEGLLGVGQALGVEREVRAVLGEHGQPGVRHAEQRDAGVAREVAQVLAHLGGAGRAVEPDHVDAEGFERGQRRADLGAQQHGAGRLEGQGAEHQEVAAHGLQGPPRAEHGGLGLQEVLGGLDDERVGAARDQALGVLLETVAQDRVGGVPQRRELGAGADGAEHPALLPGGLGEPVGGLAGDARAGLGQLVDPAGDVVLAEGGGVGSERVGLDAVHADREVLLVDRPDDVGARDVQDLVAAFEVLEVLKGGVLGLEHGAHGTVGHHHPGGERLTERCGSGPAVS